MLPAKLRLHSVAKTLIFLLDEERTIFCDVLHLQIHQGQDRRLRVAMTPRKLNQRHGFAFPKLPSVLRRLGRVVTLPDVCRKLPGRRACAIRLQAE